MKHVFFVLFIVIATSSFAQTSQATTFKISKRTFCYYNSDTHQPDNCTGGTEYTCSFVLSADETSFDLVFVDSRTHYQVLEKDYDADKNQYFYKVQNDNGSISVFLIDYSNKAFVSMSKPINEMVDNDAVTVMLIDEIVKE